MQAVLGTLSQHPAIAAALAASDDPGAGVESLFPRADIGDSSSDTSWPCSLAAKRRLLFLMVEAVWPLSVVSAGAADDARRHMTHAQHKGAISGYALERAAAFRPRKQRQGGGSAGGGVDASTAAMQRAAACEILVRWASTPLLQAASKLRSLAHSADVRTGKLPPSALQAIDARWKPRSVWRARTSPSAFACPMAQAGQDARFAIAPGATPPTVTFKGVIESSAGLLYMYNAPPPGGGACDHIQLDVVELMESYRELRRAGWTPPPLNDMVQRQVHMLPRLPHYELKVASLLGLESHRLAEQRARRAPVPVLHHTDGVHDRHLERSAVMEHMLALVCDADGADARDSHGDVGKRMPVDVMWDVKAPIDAVSRNVFRQLLGRNSYDPKRFYDLLNGPHNTPLRALSDHRVCVNSRFLWHAWMMGVEEWPTGPGGAPHRDEARASSSMPRGTPTGGGPSHAASAAHGVSSSGVLTALPLSALLQAVYRLAPMTVVARWCAKKRGREMAEDSEARNALLLHLALRVTVLLSVASCTGDSLSEVVAGDTSNIGGSYAAVMVPLKTLSGLRVRNSTVAEGIIMIVASGTFWKFSEWLGPKPAAGLFRLINSATVATQDGFQQPLFKVFTLPDGVTRKVSLNAESLWREAALFEGYDPTTAMPSTGASAASGSRQPATPASDSGSGAASPCTVTTVRQLGGRLITISTGSGAAAAPESPGAQGPESREGGGADEGCDQPLSLLLKAVDDLLPVPTAAQANSKWDDAAGALLRNLSAKALLLAAAAVRDGALPNGRDNPGGVKNLIGKALKSAAASAGIDGSLSFYAVGDSSIMATVLSDGVRTYIEGLKGFGDTVVPGPLSSTEITKRFQVKIADGDHALNITIEQRGKGNAPFVALNARAVWTAAAARAARAPPPPRAAVFAPATPVMEFQYQEYFDGGDGEDEEVQIPRMRPGPAEGVKKPAYQAKAKMQAPAAADPGFYRPERSAPPDAGIYGAGPLSIDHVIAFVNPNMGAEAVARVEALPRTPAGLLAAAARDAVRAHLGGSHTSPRENGGANGDGDDGWSVVGGGAGGSSDATAAGSALAGTLRSFGLPATLPKSYVLMELAAECVMAFADHLGGLAEAAIIDAAELARFAPTLEGLVRFRLMRTLRRSYGETVTHKKMVAAVGRILTLRGGGPLLREVPPRSGDKQGESTRLRLDVEELWAYLPGGANASPHQPYPGEGVNGVDDGSVDDTYDSDAALARSLMEIEYRAWATAGGANASTGGSVGAASLAVQQTQAAMAASRQSHEQHQQQLHQQQQQQQRLSSARAPTAAHPAGAPAAAVGTPALAARRAQAASSSGTGPPTPIAPGGAPLPAPPLGWAPPQAGGGDNEGIDAGVPPAWASIDAARKFWGVLCTAIDTVWPMPTVSSASATTTGGPTSPEAVFLCSHVAKRAAAAGMDAHIAQLDAQAKRGGGPGVGVDVERFVAELLPAGEAAVGAWQRYCSMQMSDGAATVPSELRDRGAAHAGMMLTAWQAANAGEQPSGHPPLLSVVQRSDGSGAVFVRVDVGCLLDVASSIQLADDLEGLLGLC
ncbi:hypothetical protein FOA52_015304 [Chlamydomonas sp. UWO 241]|nr:hypothetical protein FOA52_015304 [Chlamydomonas sp. UWO 241]